MDKPKLSIGSRLVMGGIAGFVGTFAMTAAMRRMHKRLPPPDAYPLTPREIVDSAADAVDLQLAPEVAKDATTLAHFAYGAASGALVAAADPAIKPATGAAAGIAIWLGSYMGWIPVTRILKPATEHPPRRNLLMLAAHLVWGASTAMAMKELVRARETILSDGLDKDVPPPRS